MKKRLPFIITFVVFFILSFFLEQDDYYLGKNILEFTTWEWFKIGGGIFAFFIPINLWSEWKPKKKMKSLRKSLEYSFYISFFLVSTFQFLDKPFKNMALLLNRMHSTESIISHHEIIGNAIEINEMKTPKDIQYNGEFEFSGTRYLSIDSAFPHLENESAKNGDSITIRQEKGLFGYYYVNREQTKIIKK